MILLPLCYTSAMKAAPDLDHLDPNLSIESAEGLDVNHASRARLQFLAAQSNALVAQTQFADAKAAALMTVSGLLALQGPSSVGNLGGAGPLVILSFLFNAACLGGCFLTIVPRFPNARIREQIYHRDRYSWPGLVDTHHDETDFPNFMRTAQISQLVVSLARANQATARILHRKFAILRATFFLGITGLVLLGINGALGLAP
ncbi:hypothetical protein KHP62_06770 [Rhodobacteraceae bacterium NNCM2]|nr:hypothetical protein [Coraliihabitans acroporae]